VDTASFAGRLLSINAVARGVLSDYSGPVLSDAVVDRVNSSVSLILHINSTLYMLAV